MKTQRLSKILTSAYLSAMLASSLAPVVRGNSTLAAIINPSAAQNALSNAATGLDTAGWLAEVPEPASVPAPLAVIVPRSPAPANDPVMTEELMGRIIKYGRDIPRNTTIAASICKVFGKCDGTAPLPIKSVSSDIDNHFFSIPVDTNTKDIYITVIEPGITHCYLTDKTGVLRAAAVQDATGMHLVINETAAAGFKAEMTQFAKEAMALPPTGGTAVAGNS